jgi:hypothetical protein
VQECYKIEEGKVLAKRFGDLFEELPLAENEDQVEYYIHRFLKFEKQVKAITDKIDATENKGSYLAKMILFSEEIKDLQAIGDFVALNQIIEGYKADLTEKVEQNRKRNAEIKSSLIESMSKIVNENNWRATEEVKEIQQKWIRVGKASDEEDKTLNAAFEALKLEFFNQKKDFYDAQKELTDSRIQVYSSVILAIEEAIDAKDPASKRTEIDQLVLQWKENGPIPKSSYDILYASYKKVLDAYFEKLKKSKKQFKSANNQDKELLEKKKEVLALLLKYKEETERYEIRKIHSFKDQWNNVGKVNGRVLGTIGDQFYQTLEFLFEYANLQNFQEKKSYSMDKSALVKTMRRFVSENEDELRMFKLNQEEMNIKFSNDSNSIFAKRLSELERKLATKKRVLESLS